LPQSRSAPNTIVLVRLLLSLCEIWVFFSSHLLCDGGRSLTTGWPFADIVSRQWIYIYIFCFGGFEELTSFLFLQLVPTDQGRQTSFMVCWFEYSGCHEVIVLIVRAFVAIWWFLSSGKLFLQYSFPCPGLFMYAPFRKTSWYRKDCTITFFVQPLW
jgi:hypothetical protein